MWWGRTGADTRGEHAEELCVADAEHGARIVAAGAAELRERRQDAHDDLRIAVAHRERGLLHDHREHCRLRLHLQRAATSIAAHGHCSGVGCRLLDAS
jgi:hypothetical protein